MGCMGRNTNEVNCADCKAYGIAQDWNDIAILHKENEELKEWAKEINIWIEKWEVSKENPLHILELAHIMEKDKLPTNPQEKAE
jgi:hypothetical protein